MTKIEFEKAQEEYLLLIFVKEKGFKDIQSWLQMQDYDNLVKDLIELIIKIKNYTNETKKR